MTKTLDAIIFGATGFTGKFAVENAVELYKDLRWGVAGRNKAKLEDVLREVGQKVNKDLLKNVPIILADVSDEQSIQKMANECKLVVNCCGPYRFYGEVVVKACIEAGTHHVDISGEAQYIDGMQLKYNELAQRHKAYVISTCGFNCITSEMGTVFAEQKFPGTVNSVEMFWENNVNYKDKSSKALLHYGTWESAVYAMGNPKEMSKLKGKFEDDKKMPQLKPKLNINPFITFCRPEKTESYFLPFTGGDRDVVRRSQRILYELEQKRPVQFEAYVGFRRFFTVAFLPLQMMLIFLMAQFRATRKVLLRYPHIFSGGIITREGPLEANVKAQYFTLTFRTRGWSKEQLLSESPKLENFTRISGYDPSYGLTSVMVLLAGRTILNESQNMPFSGGVLPPGAAFAHTSYIEELNKNGMKFEVLE